MIVGPRYLGNRTCEFVVWAPFLERVEVKIFEPRPSTIELTKHADGYWRGTATDVPPGSLYMYRLNEGVLRPDPASHHQPLGVHKPSQIVDHNAFSWDDDKWRGIELSQMVMYELHVGTFTEEGTFEAIIPRLDELKETGINTIELMPIAQFPGERNWGYDGVHPFAPQHSYGGPEGLKYLVNACHSKGIAVLLDVVYNHIGPEGNYLADFGPYFTNRYKTLWGEALNFDGPHSDPVADFFVENAMYWFNVFHIDGLRLDAIHSILDTTAKPFLAELSRRTAELSQEHGREFLLIAESNLNDPKIFRPRVAGGFELDAQWMDDFHHSVHALLTGERSGYYVDYGGIEDLAKCYREGYSLTGEYSAYRKRRQGTSSRDVPASRFIVSAQNHDQVGNRMMGDRLPAIVSFEAVKLAAATMIFSPYIPLFFMGEEYAEDAPFLYFVNHSEAHLLDSVRKGRREEFRKFEWAGEPPDPGDVSTFIRSKLQWSNRSAGRHNVMLRFVSEALKLRREIPALANVSNKEMEVTTRADSRLLAVRRWHNGSTVCLFLNFDDYPTAHQVLLPAGSWAKTFDSAARVWDGPESNAPGTIHSGDILQIAPLSALLYQKIPADK